MPGVSPVIVRVQQRTPEWLEARFDGIGASEAAAAIEVSPWESRISLWARKLRLIPPQDPTLPMLIGTELEPLIASLYTEATGVKVRRATMLRRHPEHAFMLASLDRRAGRKPIELKWSQRGEGYGDPGTDEIPDDILAQVLHQLAVVDEDEADVAAIIGTRPEVQIFTIRRDADAEAALIEREAELWRHVESRTEPPLDGSESTRAYLAARYPRDSGIQMLATPDLAGELSRALAAREAIKTLEADKSAADNALKAAMGEASRLDVPGVGYALWRTSKDRTETEWQLVAGALRAEVVRLREALTDDHGFLINAHDERLDGIESLYTTTKDGSRPFLPKPEKEPA